MKTTKLQNVINYIKHLQKVHNYKYDIFNDSSKCCDGNGLEDFSYQKPEIKLVETEGGEGEGEYYHKVFEINHPTYGSVYLKVDGTYDSWNGIDWNYDNMSLCEIKPVTRMEYVNIQDTDDDEISYEPKQKYLDFSQDILRGWLISLMVNGVVTLEFTKVSGENRVMKCTLSKDIIPKDDEYKDDVMKTKSTTAFRVFDTEKQDWRSVRWDYIKKIDVSI